MSGWRLVVDRGSYADFSLSVSPAVEKAVVAGEAPSTVYLNLFDSDSITIGVNEDPEQALDMAFCRAHNIEFRRRVNGGGPIYAGKGSAILVLFLPTAHPCVPETAAEAFPAILTSFAEVLTRRYGFAAEYRPLNDVQVEGRKLVPTSLKIEDGVMTFRIVINLKPIDTELAGKAMPMPPEKVADKELKDMTSRFTWLEREAGHRINEDEMVAMTRDFTAHAFGEAAPVAGVLTEVERRYAEDFRARYNSDEWLFGKSERVRFAGLNGVSVGRGRVKAVGGMIRAALAVSDGVVRGAIVNGDWHPRPLDSVAWLEAALEGAPADAAALAEHAAAFLARDDVEFAGIEAADLAAALEKALADSGGGHG